MFWCVAILIALVAPAKAGIDEQPLAVARNAFADELSEPAVVSRFYRLIEAEVGGQGAEAAQAFIETVLNRALARNQTLTQAMNDAGYYPKVSLRGREPSPENAQRYEYLIANARDGSNIARFSTGNASGSVRFNGGPQVYTVAGGERFGIEGPDRIWAASVGAGELAWAPAPTTSHRHKRRKRHRRD